MKLILVLFVVSVLASGFLAFGCVQPQPEIGQNDSASDLELENQTASYNSTSIESPETEPTGTGNGTGSVNVSVDGNEPIDNTTETTENEAAVPPIEHWILENGTRIAEGVSPSLINVDGKVVLYYTGMGGIFRTSSDDGINFDTPVKAMDQASNSAIIQLRNGGYRMIYNDMSTPPKPGERHPSSQYFLSAYSGDGLNWEKESGTRFRSMGAPDYDTLSVPSVIDIGNGTIRMYFVGDMYAIDYGREGNNIRSAISTDEGLIWVREPGERISGDSMDPAIVKIGDYYRMYYTVTDFELDMQEVYSAISQDGLGFIKEGVVLESPGPGQRFMDPEFMEFEGVRRMYISLATGMGQSEQTQIISAVLNEN
ncbi:hypothetical protein KKF81_05530 [Candidatus Micrarchaeota archaeon]|nr:hypothetical protein [Candidatus Micrarchaeota archaeon]MBU1166389.1 hypothetical protein [Candidatus Micrarchaeota archaeon]MBU1887179.1 hypothetical protein [Candidatus Micrarchaeota archaeon]